MPAPEWLIENAKTKRRPKADGAEPPLRPGVYYRTPFYKQSHTVGEKGAEDSLCGRPLWVDADYYMEFWEEAIGPFWLVVENRKVKGNQCGFCRQKLKALTDDGMVIAMPPKPTSRQQLEWRQEAMQWQSKIAWLRRELNVTETAT